MHQSGSKFSNSTSGSLLAGYANNAVQSEKIATLMDGTINNLNNNNIELTETSNRIQCAIERIVGGWPEAVEEKCGSLNGGGRISELQEGIARFTQNNQRLRDLAARLEQIA